MGGFFDIDPSISARAERLEARGLDDLKRTIKTGSGEKPEYLRLYTKYRYGEAITLRDYLDDPNIRGKVDYAVVMIQDTKKIIDEIFGIFAEEKEVAKITVELFYSLEYEELLVEKVERYNMILHVIQTAYDATKAKIGNAIDTLETVGAEVPSELLIAKYVRDNYNKNQRRKALTDALKDIFPHIDNKIIIDEITATALP